MNANSSSPPPLDLTSELKGLREERRMLMKNIRQSRTNNTPEEKVKEWQEELDAVDEDLAYIVGLAERLTLNSPAPQVQTVPTAKAVLPSKLPTYEEHQSIKSFLTSFERLMSLNSYPKELWVPALSQSFKGGNLHYVETRIIRSELSWEEVKESLISYFGPKAPIRLGYRKLFTFRQYPNEKIAECVNRFRQLADESTCKDNNALVAAFTNGMHNRYYYKLESLAFWESTLPDYPPLEATLMKCLEFSYLDAKNDTLRQNSSVQPSNDKTQATQQQPNKAKNSKQQSWRKGNGDRTTSVNLVTEEVPVEPSPSQESNTSDDEINNINYYSEASILVVDVNSQDGAFRAPITIEGMEMLALIDSGAAVSILDYEVATALEIQIANREGLLKFAHKDFKMQRRTTSKPISLRCNNTEIEFKPDILELPIDTPFIMGRDLMKTFRIGVTNIPYYFTSPSTPEADDVDALSPIASKELAPSDLEFIKRVSGALQLNKQLPTNSYCLQPEKGYKLNLLTNANPVWRRQYPLSTAKQHELDNTVQRWIDTGVVIRAKEGSRFNSPIMTVPKRDATGKKTGTRVCIDPRPINKILEDDHYTIPLITDIFNRTAGSHFFTTIDLKEAYTQIPLHEDSQHITAFTWRGLQYQFSRCIFGIKTMSAMFQRIITNILEDCLSFAISYVDDIVIFSKSLSEHESHVRKVIEALTRARLRINIEKSVFGVNEIRLLGFIISENGIAPDPRRLKDVFDFPTPRSTKDIQRFLGVCNCLRNHVPQYTEIARPLEKIRNAKNFVWSTETESSFKQLKQAILNSQILSLPDPNSEFFLITDASNEGISAVLYQESEKGTKFISFDSRSLSKSESKYHAHKKELLALVFGLLRNQHILRGRKFTALTDHQSLTNLFTQRHANVMMENWLDIIASFDFTPCYIPGKLNVLADALSRHPSQRKLHKTISIINKSPQGTPSSADLELIHAEGHLQGEQMVEKLKNKGISWNSMRKECEEIAKKCHLCQMFNPASPKFHKLTSIEASQPFDHVQMDLVTDLPTSTEGLNHVLVVTDVASKYTLLRPITDKSAQSVAKKLIEIIPDFGTPRIIQSDQGREFLNSTIKSLTEQLSIDHRLAAAYTPRTNGLVERTNQTWTRILKKLAFFSQKHWPQFIPATQIFLNGRIAKSIGITPFEAFFARKRYTSTEDDQSTPPLDAPNAEQVLSRIFEIQRTFWPSLSAKSQETHRQNAMSFNKNNRIDNLSVGDIVYVKQQNPTKLDPLYNGPFRICRKTKANTFELVDVANNKYHRKVPISQLKRCFNEIPNASDEERFEIEEILEHKGSPGNFQFLVKWKNYPLSDASWIPADHFDDPKTLKRYWESRGG